MIRVAAAAALVLLAAAACGHAAATSPGTARGCPAAAKALTRIDRDLANMRHATTRGALSALTDRFLLHVGTAPISNLQRNRLIDHAAAIVSIRCPDCFQALEAERPIPAIRQGDLRCSKA